MQNRRPVCRAAALIGLAALWAQTAAAVDGISDHALQQIAVLQAEKDTRSPAQQKLESQLLYALKRSRNQELAPGITNLLFIVSPDTNGQVKLDITATVTQDLLNFVQQAGGRIINSFPQFQAVRAYFPLSQIENLGARAEVNFVQVAGEPVTWTGSVDSEGDTTHRVINARNRFAVDGTGIKVGVLSDSDDYLANSQATGDLPLNVTVLPGQSGVPGTGEGTAMMQIVYDLVPGAQLFFASASGGAAQMAQNILDLRAAGCNVIVDDVLFPFNEAPFQDSVVARAVNTVTADGALYFSSAGNQGNKAHGTSGTWEGDFVDGGAAGAPVNGKGGRLHSFGANAYNSSTLDGAFTLLFWSDPINASTNDYDLYVLDSTGQTVLGASTTVQNGTQSAVEGLIGDIAPGYRMVVVKTDPAAPRYLRLENFLGQLEVTTVGTARGHAGASNAFCVAATDIHNSFPNSFVGGAANPVETFSADGPRHVFFNPDGTAITPGNFLASGGFVRPKDDVTAADGVSTTVPGFAPFYGTSAAAPHAAAIGALLLSFNPDLTPDQIHTLFRTSTLDIEAAGVDVTSGGGIVMADLLLAAAPSPGLSIETNYISGGNGNGIVDPNECNDLYLVLRNHAGVTATGVSGTLSSTTPGVIIAQRTSPYLDIPQGATGTNLVAFKISTSPSFVCGTPIDLVLLIKTDQKISVAQLRLQTGAPGVPLRFDNNISVPIPDNNPFGAYSPVVVSGITSTVAKVTVSLHITHTYDADLVLQLVSPDGATNTLAANRGSFGQNFGTSCSPDGARTGFDDNTNTSIASASAPFVGTFTPDQPLSVFIGKSGTNVNGTWQLHAVDQAAIDVGTIDCWSLFVTPASCQDGGGQCPGVDLGVGITDAPDPTFVGSNLVYNISVTNRGPNTAHGVAVNLPLPNAAVYVSGNASQGSVVFSGGTVSASLGNMNPTASATVTIIVIPTTNGLLFATASVGAVDTELNPSDNSATAVTYVNANISDVAVGLLDSPDPVLVGGTLTYTVFVTNNGPSTARSVTVTNVLPNSVTVLGASSSISNFAFAGNIVIWSVNTMPLGAFASANIQVRPNAEGTIIATATAGSQLSDPIQVNNTATASTTVGPSADVGIGIREFPNPVVVGSNLTYVVSITNFGPSTATGITLNQTLPPSVTLLSSNTTQGTIAVAGGSLLGNLGSLASGAKATVTLLVATSTNTTLITSATVSATETDVNPGNNAVTATAIVTNRILIIAPDGAKLTFESFCPANGTIEPGETVTNLFFLSNAGNVVNTNLVATLLPGGGVVAPSGPRSYGVLAPSGFSVGQPFSFTASGTNGGTVTATFSLKDGPNILSNVSFTFSLPTATSFSNTNVVAIPDSGFADPYPSTITVSGISGLVGKVTATLSDFTHSYPHDVSALLVGPSGAKTILMSHVADQSSVSHATLTFVNDCVAPVLPEVGTIGSGSWQPSAYPPAVTNSPFDGTTYANMSIYSGVDPSLINGTWSLYVLDDTPGDFGGISNGWSLTITTISPVSQLPDLDMTVSAVPGPLHAGDPLLYSFSITNAGPGSASGVGFTNALPASLNLVSVVSSQGSFTTNGGVVIANLGSIGVGSGATISILTQPNAAGLITNTAAVFGRETDPHPANNTASAITSVVLPFADVGVSLAAATNSLVSANPISYTVTVTNRGPENAVNIVVTDSLPKGLGFGSTSLSSGYWSNQGGVITCNLGTLLPATATSFTITATATNSGVITNIVTVAATSSTDTNSANNSASAVISVAAISPSIIAAGATLNSENLNQNGAIDPGETVNVSLALANIGSQDTVNLRATLLATGGVTSPSAAQNYGVLIQNGPSASKSFTFTASSSPAGGAVVATLQLTDLRSPNLDLGTVSISFNVAATNIFANSNAITIPDHGPGNPYPSIMTISNLPGIITKVTATVSGLTHSFARDVNILLVNPAGGSVKLMSHTSGAHAVTNATLTFDDAAAQALPGTGQIYDGTYYPTSYLGSVTFNSPAPSGSYGTAMNALNSVSPNGQWSLYVLDDAAGDSGNIANGWSLKISTLSPLNPVSDRLSISRIGITSQSLLTLSGLSVHGYQLLISSNLTSWTPVMTGTTAPNGTIQLTITNALNRQYYRSLRLP